jgi:hypothetical protein
LKEYAVSIFRIEGCRVRNWFSYVGILHPVWALGMVGRKTALFGVAGRNQLPFEGPGEGVSSPEEVTIWSLERAFFFLSFKEWM